MAEQSVTLTRRRLLGGIVFVGGASLAAGAGTMAAFSDSETISDNSIQAGTLDLTLTEVESATFLDEANIVPGDDGSEELLLTNEGTVDGTLDISIGNIEVSDTNNGQTQIAQYLELSATVINRSNGDQTEIFTDETVDSLEGSEISHPTIPIPAKQSREFVLDWMLPENTHNQARSDSVQFDLTFQLTQTGGSA